MALLSAGAAPWLRVLFVALTLIAALHSSHALAAADADDADETLELMTEGSSVVYKLPSSMITLSDTTFEGYLFPKNPKQPRAFFVALYSPWCPHCKTMLPHFIDASRQLEALGIPHSSFGVADVVEHKKISEHFSIHHFPTLVYTTGKGRQWHLYDGANTVEAFMQFSAYLQRAVVTGSFSEDVTDVARFDEVETKMMASRVGCYVYVPSTSSSRPDNQRTAAWSQVIDAAASVSNIRFSVIYEANQAEDWADHASSVYKAVTDAAKACAAGGKTAGPDGEVLVVNSDRYRTPKCFTGAWSEQRADAPAGLESTMSKSLENFLTLHGFHAVDDASSSMFDTLEHFPRNYLGMIMTGVPIDAHDTQYLPVLREITQAANEALEQQHGRELTAEEEVQAPRVSWSYINVEEYEVWKAHYDVKSEQLPAVLIIDTKRDRYFKMRTRVPRFEAIKLDAPWQIGGEQHQLIQKFAQDVLADVYGAEKLSYAGAFAEFLSHYPGFSHLYELLNYEDFVFDIVVMVLGFFTFLMFLAVVVEPLTERYDERQKKQAAPKVKTD